MTDPNNPFAAMMTAGQHRARAMNARIACLVAVFSTVAPMVQAQALDTWNTQRAEAFVQVCLASAPSFASMEQKAADYGFSNTSEGLLLEPEVFVSLREEAGTCTCLMTMGAPDQTQLVGAIFQEMLKGFAADFRPDDRGLVNDTTFVREETPVRVTLMPAEIDAQPWVAGRVTREGAC